MSNSLMFLLGVLVGIYVALAYIKPPRKRPDSDIIQPRVEPPTLGPDYPYAEREFRKRK